MGLEFDSRTLALLDGDGDDMMVVGRNGIFYDRHGKDWHASVLKVIENPISVRQAFWSPYKRISRMINEQVQKFAAAKDKAIEEKSSASVADGTKAHFASQAFDIAKFAGIFEAISLAFGGSLTGVASLPKGTKCIDRPSSYVARVMGAAFLSVVSVYIPLLWQASSLPTRLQIDLAESL